VIKKEKGLPKEGKKIGQRRRRNPETGQGSLVLKTPGLCLKRNSSATQMKKRARSAVKSETTIGGEVNTPGIKGPRYRWGLEKKPTNYLDKRAKKLVAQGSWTRRIEREASPPE